MNSLLENLNFDLRINIVFGKDKSATISDYLKENNYSKVMIITDEGLKKSGVLTRIFEGLNNNNIVFKVFDEVEPNPKDITVHNATKIAEENRVQAVIGIGGGSSMDTAKAVGILYTNKGEIKDYAGKDKVEKQPLPILCIPTTAGTGSEVTANAAITSMQDNYKMSIKSKKIIPKLSILDPELLKTMPPFICATSSIDALTHAIEGYLSNKATTFTDMIAIKSIEILSKNIKPFYADPSNTVFASNMLYGSMLAGIVISETGTGNAHALARSLGGKYDIAHGHACAMFLSKVLNFNRLARPHKYKVIAKSLGLIDFAKPIKDEEVNKEIIEYIESLLDSLSIPKYLYDVGVSKSSFNDLAKIALKSTGPNPRKTTFDDLLDLLKETYTINGLKAEMNIR
ncbi:MAG TPA: iron-containing alcohol dehydrogenase [Pseudogracilibacillus sp.]|nr:iron-containing alcohol dehydrogenase [Pseudogracilibacillus sp.]